MSKMNWSIGAGYFQVCYVVRDIHAAEAYCLANLGIRRFMKFENLEAKDRMYMGRPSDFKMHLYFAIAGDGPLVDPLGPSTIELIQPVAGESIYRDALAEGREGLHHLGYAVKNYDETVATMKRQGRTMLQSSTLGDMRFCYFDDGPLGRSVTELVDSGPDLTQLLRTLIHGDF
ncbi:MAG: VOC family protein [Deltaproteobacteria bacterium]|nr:VOC family protein [Deltaproteobacteria bacterium]